MSTVRIILAQERCPHKIAKISLSVFCGRLLWTAPYPPPHFCWTLLEHLALFGVGRANFYTTAVSEINVFELNQHKL